MLNSDLPIPIETLAPDTECLLPGAAPKRLRVLISAYACEPGKGSEAGVGWNMALQMAKLHDVYVLTRANNRVIIEPALPDENSPNFIYYDLPKWAMWWKRGPRGAQLYYYLWQIFAGRMLKKLNCNEKFDVGHHVTYVRYWMPTIFPSIGMPYVIGPVGGGEFAPVEFENRFPFKSLIYEKVRRIIRAFVPFDPFVRNSIRHAACVLTTTNESRAKVAQLGARRIEVYPESGVSKSEFSRLSTVSCNAEGSPIIFVSSGRLLALKAFELGLKAFARSNLTDAEYWIIGDGPEGAHLKQLVHELGMSDRVRFLGWIERSQALAALARAHVLVHPSLHDSGGWVCPEAMAMGKAVICLDLGGPGAQINEKTGIKVNPSGINDAITGMAEAMNSLAHNRGRLKSMGLCGKKEVEERYIWENKCRHYSDIYFSIIDKEENGAAS